MGVISLIIVWPHLELNWGIGLWIYFVICIISGALIQMAVNWICASICFWTVRSSAIIGVAERFTVLMQQYPVDIFGMWFQVFVTCFLPVAFINYYPSIILLGKKSVEINLLMYAAPVVAALLILVAALLWVRGVHRYSGSGN